MSSYLWYDGFSFLLRFDYTIYSPTCQHFKVLNHDFGAYPFFVEKLCSPNTADIRFSSVIRTLFPDLKWGNSPLLHIHLILYSDKPSIKAAASLIVSSFFFLILILKPLLQFYCYLSKFVTWIFYSIVKVLPSDNIYPSTI